MRKIFDEIIKKPTVLYQYQGGDVFPDWAIKPRIIRSTLVYFSANDGHPRHFPFDEGRVEHSRGITFLLDGQEIGYITRVSEADSDFQKQVRDHRIDPRFVKEHMDLAVTKFINEAGA